jgi:hypothetical protein
MKSSAKPAALKVFGTRMFIGGPDGSVQRRVIVATTSRTAAARLIGMSAYEAKDYMALTGNGYEVGAALSFPGVPLGELCGPGRQGLRIYRRIDVVKRELIGEDIGDRG